MNIVYQGDIHMRDGRPGSRVDDYQTAQFKKLQQLVNFANEHDAVLAIGGDLFDTHKVSAEVVNKTSEILDGVNHGRVVCCLGQHDVPYHQVDIMKSPVCSLVSAGVLDVGPTKRYGDHLFHILNWEQPPSPPEDGQFNILLGHVSVFHKEIPFYWEGEGYTAETLKKKYPGYDLYLCGDIHKAFVDKGVVVSGSMMRLSIDQRDTKPRCYLLETDCGTFEPLYYDIEEEVFSVDSLTDDSESMDLDNLVLAMQESGRVKQSFKQDCIALAKDNPKADAIIKEIFDELS